MSQIRILEVTDVQVQILKSKPPQLIIAAAGTVPTSGWNNGALIPWRYIRVPDNKIQDFDFVATPPNGVVLEVIRPISAQIHGEVDIENYWGPGVALAGIQIHARNNSWLFELNGGSLLATSNPVPWPWIIP